MQIPEAVLINTEILLRDMQLTKEVRMTRKSLIRWLALAMGLISPNESRKTMIDILTVLFEFQLKSKEDPEFIDMFEKLKKINSKYKDKAIRYHLLQLKNNGIITRTKGRYHFIISPFSEKGDIEASFEYAYKIKAEIAVQKIKEALRILKDMHKHNVKR